MSRRLLAYSLLLILMVSTIGINVRSHYCGESYVGSVVNGFTFVSGEGSEMEGCMDDHNTCPHCKNVKHSYRISSQFMKGQVPQTQPLALSLDWFHAVCQAAAMPTFAFFEVAETVEYHYTPPPLTHPYMHVRGLRAPPRA